MEHVRSKDGTLIAYQRSGSGPPLILIHGAVADHTRWTPLLASLEEHRTVYALDRRGRGASGDTEPYVVQREAEDVAAVIDSLSGKADVLGHSFGAFCALEAALLTSNIRKLILYEPPPPGVTGTLPPDVAARMQAGLDAGDREAVVSTFLLEIAKLTPQELELMRSSPAWAGRVAAAHTILREIRQLEEQPPFAPERFAALHIPVLLLLGGESPAFYKDNIERIHAMLPDSRIVVMPGQQHVAMNTAPDLFLREALSFLLDD